MQHIQIPSLDDNGNRSTNETIEVERLGPNCFRLLTPPAIAEGLAIDDQFELDDKESCGFKIIKHSGFLLHLGILRQQRSMPAIRQKQAHRRSRFKHRWNIQRHRIRTHRYLLSPHSL